MTSMPLRCAQISSCSTAAARKVSAAQSITLSPSLRRRFASLPMLVVLPAPFTPTTKITRGPLPLGDAPAAPGSGPAVEAADAAPEAARIRTMCDLISRLSWLASDSALRSIFSRTASRISRVVRTPRSAESRAVLQLLEQRRIDLALAQKDRIDGLGKGGLGLADRGLQLLEKRGFRLVFAEK